ncbi:uncharacterized protein KIAA1143 homolog [Manduca sexta]|uniref:DUF4604 domain-containing protein n=1 Tax=Manduca sexta TaxID=7130 RepID=A0A921ZPS2_MANSE|nr:uncharacterized protein KIAA1143 homolog [Manduca sexta]KAG6461126.1 hypothetical protein O3G_MSEX012431 [Manduca sexta]
MNRKRNVAYTKPEDPEFLKNIKRQAGYDDRNPKFDKYEITDSDFVDDEESEQPQVVVLKQGDLTAEEAEIEMKKIEIEESEIKADLTQRVIFKSKRSTDKISSTKNRKSDIDKKFKVMDKKSRNLLSFDDDDDEDEN